MKQPNFLFSGIIYFWIFSLITSSKTLRNELILNQENLNKFSKQCEEQDLIMSEWYPKKACYKTGSKRDNNRTTLIVTVGLNSEQFNTSSMTDKLYWIMTVLFYRHGGRGRPFLAHRSRPSLKLLLIHNKTTSNVNMDTGNAACNKPRC